MSQRMLKEPVEDYIVNIAKVKGSLYQVPNRYKELLEERKEEIFQKIGEVYGEETRKNVENWYETSFVELPGILGWGFSNNMVAVLYANFSRFFIDKLLGDEQYADSKRHIVREFYIDRDIPMRVSSWIRRDTSFVNRFLSFNIDFRKGREINRMFLAFLYYKLMDTPLVNRGVESEFQKQFAKNVLEWLKFGYILEEQAVNKEMDELVKDYLNWLMENTPLVPYPNKENPTALKLLRRDRTMFYSVNVRLRWITRKAAKLLGIDEEQSDEVLFPNLHRMLLEKHPEYIKKSEEKAEKFVSAK